MLLGVVTYRTWQHGRPLSRLDEVRVPADLRLDEQVSVHVLFGVHWAGGASSSIHDELLFFRHGHRLWVLLALIRHSIIKVMLIT